MEGKEAGMLRSVESLNRHSNISIFLSAFTFAFVRSFVRSGKEGRKEGGWLTDRKEGREGGKECSQAAAGGKERRALTR